MPPPSRFPRDMGCMLFSYFALLVLIPALASLVVPSIVSFHDSQCIRQQQSLVASLLRAHASIEEVRRALGPTVTEIPAGDDHAHPGPTPLPAGKSTPYSTILLHRRARMATWLYFDLDGRLVNFAVTQQ